MRRVLDELVNRQREWARGAGVATDAQGYCATLEANLFQPLSPATRREFEAGDGGELGAGGKRAKMQALHSSAALACNVFDPWRGRDLAPLARALGTAELGSLAFEQRFPTGLAGNPPNLDVVLREVSGCAHAIEAKFTEPFRQRAVGAAFRPSYFAGARLWAERGLPGCQGLAERLRSEPLGFAFLDAPQLLKHMLGLATNEVRWQLWLLWFDPGGEAGDRTRAEIGRFVDRVEGDAERFSSVTYQELFERMLPIAREVDSAWCSYVGSRYFEPKPTR